MSDVCSNCGVEIGSGMPCPLCGEKGLARSVLTATDRFAAACAYFALIPAIVFLLLTRFKTNRFVRFHSFQSILFVMSAIVVAGILRGFFLFFSFIPFLVAALIVTIVGLAYFALWIVLLVKAFQGREFKVRWIGGLADRKAKG